MLTAWCQKSRQMSLPAASRVVQNSELSNSTQNLQFLFQKNADNSFILAHTASPPDYDQVRSPECNMQTQSKESENFFISCANSNDLCSQSQIPLVAVEGTKHKVFLFLNCHTAGPIRSCCRARCGRSQALGCTEKQHSSLSALWPSHCCTDGLK